MIGYISISVTHCRLITLKHRQYSAIADLHTLHFTFVHALGFQVFTSRLLATDLNTETITVSVDHTLQILHINGKYMVLFIFNGHFSSSEYRRICLVFYLSHDFISQIKFMHFKIFMQDMGRLTSSRAVTTYTVVTDTFVAFLSSSTKMSGQYLKIYIFFYLIFTHFFHNFDSKRYYLTHRKRP
jgi:hypothetical protein